jgi:hypothetical protein
MIDDKKIEEAARLDDKEYYDRLSDNDRCFFEYGFRRGYNRALKDLCHPASEEPREFAEVLAEAKITESIKTYISFKRNDALFKNWDAYSSGANITRWLYIDDLFPKGGK